MIVPQGVALSDGGIALSGRIGREPDWHGGQLDDGIEAGALRLFARRNEPKRRSAWTRPLFISKRTPRSKFRSVLSQRWIFRTPKP